MPDADKYTHMGAEYDETKAYRYLLTRTWDDSRPRMTFIGLNPSTATEYEDDPTIRRIVGFAQRFGMGGLDMLNLFAYRATDPQVMKAQAEPVGPSNDQHIQDYTQSANLVIAGWGTHGAYRQRERHVVDKYGPFHCLGTTKAGHPKHPLYLKADTELSPFGQEHGGGLRWLDERLPFMIDYWCLHCERCYYQHQGRIGRHGEILCPYPDCDGDQVGDRFNWQQIAQTNGYPSTFLFHRVYPQYGFTSHPTP